MKILHVIPGDNFTEGMAYQDNFLSAFNAKHGHEVMILSSCKAWKNSQIEYLEPCDITLENGVRLIRREYKRIINTYYTRKIRILNNAYLIIEQFQPDVIRVLNPHNFTVPIVMKYKKKHPNIKIYIDSHQQLFNSGIGFSSYWIFHKILIKNMLKMNIKDIEKIFYSEEGVKVFLRKMYGVSDSKMELYPLGGIIIDGSERDQIRNKIRTSLGIEENDIMIVHSGKMDEAKNTKEILEAFIQIKAPLFKLVIIGSIPENMKCVLLPLIDSDNRVIYLGWKDSSELFEYICSGDLYLQPGSASVTFKQAMCCGRAIVVSPNISGYDIYMDNTGWYGNTTDDLLSIFNKIQLNPKILLEKGINSHRIAKEILDYDILAKRLYV